MRFLQGPMLDTRAKWLLVLCGGLLLGGLGVLIKTRYDWEP